LAAALTPFRTLGATIGTLDAIRALGVAIGPLTSVAALASIRATVRAFSALSTAVASLTPVAPRAARATATAARLGALLTLSGLNSGARRRCACLSGISRRRRCVGLVGGLATEESEDLAK
jgi:hypothetical protein